MLVRLGERRPRPMRHVTLRFKSTQVAGGDRVRELQQLQRETLEAIGASESWPFLRDCFKSKGMPFLLTKRDSDEHLRLWQTKDK